MENTTVDKNENKIDVSSEYWRSLDEKYKTPEFLASIENEFESSPLKTEEGKSGLARRQFMKLMGASIALSTAACVRRPVQKIIPYNKRPKDIIPGLANYYASSWYDAGQGLGTVVKTREGRPLHVAGNPQFPMNGQGLSARASAHILSLYDPDRLTGPVVNSLNPKKRRNSIPVKRGWENVDGKVSAQLKKGGVRILSSSYPSEHTHSLMKSFVDKFDGELVEWDALTTETVRRGQEICYGTEVTPRYHFDKSKLTVSIDADFLGTYLSPVEFTRRFSEGRNPDGSMSRLVSFHSMPTLTTLNADDSHPIRASHQFYLAFALLKDVLAKKGKSLPPGMGSVVRTDEQLGLKQGTLAQLAKDLLAHKGQSLVVAGGMATETENALNLQLIVNWLNSELDNEGVTVSAKNSYQGHHGTYGQLKMLIADMKAGKVKTLVLHNVNPVYALAANFGFEEALNNVEMVVSTNNWMDETSKRADIVAPAGHAMENWNEFEFVAGAKAIQQPTIRPLHDTRSFEDSLMAWSKAAGSPVSSFGSFFEVVKSKVSGGTAEWTKYLKAGFIGEAAAAGSARSFDESAMLKALSPKGPQTEMELVLYPTAHLMDGSLNNVSWLLELPDVVTKVCWDNYVAVSPNKAKEMGLSMGGIVKVKTADHEAELPVYIQPGLNDSVVAVAVGYGREAGGSLAEGVGVNAFPFAKWAQGNMLFSGMKVQLEKTRGHRELAITQGHHSMEGRQIVAEASFDNYKKGSNGIHKHKVFSIWGKHKYDGHRWGMAIDLNSCTGCSACVISCQSENNVPVVGRKYILQGREMHWIRIDRYYKGSDTNPDAVFQPVMCQHCENAPCETVCPVLATVHSDEGLNDMVYNRCVGTRYCSNNCPYKVRRFNWFYYGAENTKEPLNMALNPEVSVRTRGVMEKCTFCVQRIKEAKNTAADEERALKDGDIVTACQEVCPTNAIKFGDINDKKSEVAAMFESQREYTLLEEYNAAPRVRYLAKIRNTDRDIGGGHHGAEAHHGNDNSHKEEH